MLLLLNINIGYYFLILTLKMKKMPLFLLLALCLFNVWCDKYNLWDNESLYDDSLTIGWVWPDISFEPTVENWTLVLKWTFDDHTDHVFISNWMWESYFENEFDFLPWNVVRFKWVVESIDWAAWNHYYNVKSIEELKVQEYPSASVIKGILDSYNYCEVDSDCTYFWWVCPLWCYITLNKNFIDIAWDIVSKFSESSANENCDYSCEAMYKSVCSNFKCEMIGENDIDDDIHVCSWIYNEEDFQKKYPELACDDAYDPVCANDWNTYDNDCYACSSPLVETYTFGKCNDDNVEAELDS